jgi:hypothetical protein
MISIKPAKMKIARKLNGIFIDGYCGYYGKAQSTEGYYFIIAIPFEEASVARLMKEIESEG